MIVTGVDDVTIDVVMLKVAVVFPCETVTDTGTVAAALSLLSVTTAPPVGAAAVSVTVPVELFPPITEVGFTLTELNDAGIGSTVNTAVRFTDA